VCIGIPGLVTEVHPVDGVAMATVDYGEVHRTACLAFAPEVRPGDFVIVQAGFATSVVDAGEAARTYELLTLAVPEVPEDAGHPATGPGANRP
jgi:hydrogenase expression/formation protein HypC